MQLLSIHRHKNNIEIQLLTEGWTPSWQNTDLSRSRITPGQHELVIAGRTGDTIYARSKWIIDKSATTTSYTCNYLVHTWHYMQQWLSLDLEIARSIQSASYRLTAPRTQSIRPKRLGCALTNSRLWRDGLGGTHLRVPTFVDKPTSASFLAQISVSSPRILFYYL